MRAFVSCLTAVLLFVAGPALTDTAEAVLIRLKNGGKIRCMSISIEGGMVDCESMSGRSSYPETIIEEIVRDDDAGYAGTRFAPVVEATTYGEGKQRDLIEAVSEGDVNAVEKLLGEGADIDGAYQWEPVKLELPPGAHGPIGVPVSALSGTPSGVTPLMLAARVGNPIMVQFLLERGANPNVRKKADDMGRSSALFASAGNAESVRLILARQPDYASIETTFVHLATNEYLVKTCVDIFLEHGISDRCREMAIIQARKDGNETIVQLLQAAYFKHDASTRTDAPESR